MRTERSEPILPARSLDETRAFYKNLGFDSWFNGRGLWEYEILSRGHLVVHFFLESGLIPGENDTMCYWRVRDAIHRATSCELATISTQTPLTCHRKARESGRSPILPRLRPRFAAHSFWACSNE